MLLVDRVKANVQRLWVYRFRVHRLGFLNLEPVIEPCWTFADIYTMKSSGDIRQLIGYGH